MTKSSQPDRKKGSKRFAAVILAGTLFPAPTPAPAPPLPPIAGPIVSPGASTPGTEYVRPAPAPSPPAPESPENQDLDDFAEVQRQQREEYEVTRENLERAHLIEERHGVEVSRPPKPEDPDLQAALARAERYGDAITALDDADAGVAEAEQRLVDAQAAEESGKHDPASTELDHAAARFATSDAQAALTHAQSVCDQADMELRDARGEGPRDRDIEYVRDAPGPDALGEPAAEELRAIGQRAEASGLRSEAEIRRARMQERNRVAANPAATTDLDATLDGHLGELNRSLQAARIEANGVTLDADRQARAERLQVMADRREGIEQAMRESLDRPAQRSDDVAFVSPEVTERVGEVSAEANRRLAEIDARVASVHKARGEAFAAIDSATRSANITAENAREAVADARRLANEGPSQLPPVVIGEHQDRVDYAARLFQAERYGGLTPEAARLDKGSIELERAQLAHNEAWLRQAIADGRVVIDTGPAESKVDYPRPTEGAHGGERTRERGYFETAAYEMERRLADPYGRTVDMSEDMSRTSWQDATGQRYMRNLDETARERLRAQGIDPDTVQERAWKFGAETYGAGEEGAPTRDLVPEHAVPAGDFKRVDGAAPMAVRLDAEDGHSRIAKQGGSDEALETRHQILQAHERGESVTLYRLVSDTKQQRPFNDQLWTPYDPSSFRLSDEHVETRELVPGEGFAVGNYRGGTPIGAEVAIARDAPAVASSDAPVEGPTVTQAPDSPGPHVVPGAGGAGASPVPSGGGDPGGPLPPGGNGGSSPPPPPEPQMAPTAPELTGQEQPADPQLVQEQAAKAQQEQQDVANMAEAQLRQAAKVEELQAERPGAQPEDRAKVQAQQKEAPRAAAEEDAAKTPGQQEQAGKTLQEQAANTQQQDEKAQQQDEKAQQQEHEGKPPREQVAKEQQERPAKAQQEQAAKPQQEQAAKAQQPEPAAKAQEEQTAKAQQEHAAKAHQEQAAKAQQEQASKAQAQQEQAAKAQAQQEQAATARAQQEQAAKAKAQQEQTAKAKAQQEQATKARAQQQEQAAKAKAHQEQAAKAKAQQEQARQAAQQKAQQEQSAKESNSRAAQQREAKQREAHQRRGQETSAAKQQQRRQQEPPQRSKQK